ncbi:MAG: PEGA domain-containing protein [Candidatus Omnitrophica bacterium]|nr:PEGA domain-containing protein [Candidatus Omnitrophota bacterium]MBU4305969.1 PEGA domain-containing protein [Candidatus Omnitrophota bacterium]MBU4477765.1 PEGA domain-containing protein [Candidatus Omnitrophota bacterium]
MMSLKIPFIAVTLLAFVACGNVCAETPQPSTDKVDKPLAVAIFSRNKTRDAGYEKYADMLRSGLVSQLSGKFTVIDKDDVVNVFERETKKEVTKSSDLWSYLQMLSELKKEEKEADKQGNVDNRTIEQKSSALRISQAIGANYFLIADVEEIVSNNIKDTVYGNQVNDMRITADLAVKILDGVRGGTILAENVRVEKRLRGDEKTIFNPEDVAQALPVLMKQAAGDVAKKFLDNIEKVRGFEVDAVKVKFKVKTNVPSSTVEIDGMAIGTAPGEFQAISGAHRIRVTKDGYRAFERDVNIIANAEFSVSLEETGERQDAKIKSDTAEADNYSTKKKADAEYKHGPKKTADW